MTASSLPDAPPRPTPIDCETAVRRLWDYLDGRLPALAREEVDAHLATCLLCPPHFEFARTMQAALAASAERDAARDAARDAERAGRDAGVLTAERLRDRIREALRREGRRSESTAKPGGDDPLH